VRGGLRPPQAVVLLVGLAAGLAGTAVALGGRDADDEFLAQQRNPLSVRRADVERAARSAPEPVASRRSPVVTAHCRAAGSGDLRNPWTCRLRYRSGTIAHYRITVGPDGSFVGDHLEGTGVLKGCCVEPRTGG
jgi:hypothetical protein